MPSLYDELSDKLKKDPRLTKNLIPRTDISLLLFNFRDDLRDLWIAADRSLDSQDSEADGELRGAVEKLRPLFGDRL
jgi:hypothetical protein